MQSLEQTRARNALRFSEQGKVSGDNGGEVIKKIPALIQNHGLLATAAYSFSEKEGWQKVFDAIANHLADPTIGIVPLDCTTREKLMKFLTEGNTSSEVLKLATVESMAWLLYARRFVRKN
jgi:CRISPR/Cas system CMR-associated protein Cmr5 small subunit